MNRVQVLLSGLSMRLFCFFVCLGKNCMYVWLYIFLGCTRACGCDVICVGHNLNRCTGWVVSLRCKCSIVWVK